MGKFLSNVTSGTRERPLSLVLYGREGVGKSTMLKYAPSPIFLCEYSGTDELDVKRLPPVDTWDDVLGAIDELRREEHQYKTFVLDTADWLEPIIWRAVCKRGVKGVPVESIEDFGYGKGYTAALDEWRRLLSLFEDLRERRGMNIAILAHAQIRTFQNPYGDNYDRYEMKLNKSASALLKEWPMAVLFATFEVATKKDSPSAKKAKAYGEGSRIIHTQPRPAWDAKSRYSLPETIAMSWQEFESAARKKSPENPDEVRSHITELIADADELTRTQAKASLARCGTDEKKLALLADWLRTKVKQNSGKEVKNDQTGIL
jgi:AAA domain-containing protein